MTENAAGYEITRKGDTLLVCVREALNATTSPALEEALKAELDGVCQVTVDLDGVKVVSSMGLRLLLVLYKRMEKCGTMRIVNVGDSVMEVFEVSGFSDIFRIE